MDALSPARAALERPQALALLTRERSFSYGELSHCAANMAAELSRRDPTEGELAFVATPSWRSVALVWALLESRRSFVLLHPKWGEAERARALALVPQARVLSAEELCELAAAAPVAPDSARRAGSATCHVTLFTSGSSGLPRGVQLSRRALLASAHASLANLPLDRDDRWLLSLPFAHVGGLSVITRSLVARTAVVLNERFEARDWLDTVRQSRVSVASLVPTMLHDVLREDAAEALRDRTLLLGGAALPARLRDDAIAAGARALASYGLTEACSQVATQSPSEGRVSSLSHVGRPLPGMGVRVVDDEGRSCPIGEPGRIVLSGPALFDGYVGEPRRDPEEPFDTRDVGSFDAAGQLHVLGRSDDAIITGGENVFPAEVEAALLSLPGVHEVVVFGLDDPRWGQLVAAALVAAPGTDAVRLLQGAALGLASFKRPRAVALFQSLPRNASGKLDRREVISRARERVQRLA